MRTKPIKPPTPPPPHPFYTSPSSSYLLAGRDEWSTHFIYIIYLYLLLLQFCRSCFLNIIYYPCPWILYWYSTDWDSIWYICLGGGFSWGGEGGVALCETQFCTCTQISPQTSSIHSICCSKCIFNMYLYIQNILKTKKANESMSLSPPPPHFSFQVTSIRVSWLWQ